MFIYPSDGAANARYKTLPRTARSIDSAPRDYVGMKKHHATDGVPASYRTRGERSRRVTLGHGATLDDRATAGAAKGSNASSCTVRRASFTSAVNVSVPRCTTTRCLDASKRCLDARRRAAHHATYGTTWRT